MIITNANVNSNANLNFATIPIYPYQEVAFENTLTQKDQLSLSKHKEGGCCCTCGKGIKGNIIFLIVMCIFTLGLSFGAKLTAFSTMDEYEFIKKIISINIEEEDDILKSYYSNTFRFEKFWIEFDDFESKIIIVDIICSCILLIFLIIELIIYSASLKKETKSSILRSVIVFFNYLFYVCFNILFTLFIYAFIYSIIVLNFNPSFFLNNNIYKNEEKSLNQNKYVKGVIHIIILLMLMIFNCLLTSTDNTIFFLLEMYNEEDDNNNLQKNMDKIKTKSIFIGNQDINIQINLNKCLYLKDLSAEGKTCEFRQILLENVRNDFIYINVENKSIQNMLSISNWKYPNMDPMINYLKPLARLIFISMIITYIPTLFHIKDQNAYQKLTKYFNNNQPEKIKFISIFKIVGNFENGITISRFYVYIIILVGLLLFILKRIYFGGFSRLLYINLSFVLSILLFLINIIYLILTICLSVFLILSDITVINYLKTMGKGDKEIISLLSIFIIHTSLNVSFWGEMVKPSLTQSKELFSYINDIKKDLLKLNETNELGKTEFQYNGLDSNPHKLTEVIIPGHPRYIYYSLNNIDNINNNANNNDNNNVLYLNNNEIPPYSNTNRFDEKDEIKVTVNNI